jgi:sulfatase modifying factor 1
MNKSLIPTVILIVAVASTLIAAPDTPETYTNSFEMKFVKIKPGTFRMGQLQTPMPSEVLPIFRGRGLFDALKDGDYDEQPVHNVKITKPFLMAVTEVTNYQYELFSPEHKKLRGKNGFSTGDNEPVTFVSYYDAVAFCRWLSEKDDRSYRLPTEAEWEYACRAGTETNYHTGVLLTEPFLKNIHPQGGTTVVRDLTVAQTPANAWGLCDMHGNIEEWCLDWYGPYTKDDQTDPIGYAVGEFKVTRGGSHGSDAYYQRSANRMGAIPESRNWVTGFRVVIADMPETKPLPVTLPRTQQDVVDRPLSQISKGPDPDQPYFRGPIRYTNMPFYANGPVFSCHNHDPAIVECPNGDLLAVWYTCHDEHGRELALAGSRLRWGQTEWPDASLFFFVPDRNNHAPNLGYDEKTGKIFHVSGVSAAKSRGRSAIAMRTSDDSGATWTPPRLIVPTFEADHLPSEPFIRTSDDKLMFTIDGPNTVWASADDGLNWYNPGGKIPGIHTGLAELSDGRLFALSRGAQVDGAMPISLSSDGGKSFTSIASQFHTIDGGQRLALVKLRTGELFVASFTYEKGKGVIITDSAGNKREIRGLFAAMSEDDGKTWPYMRLITDDGPARTIECTDGAAVTMSARLSEYRGYLSACQSLDGLVHVISSRNHFAFNKKWLKTTPPPPVDKQVTVKAAKETFNGPKFDLDDWHHYKGYWGYFMGKGTYRIDSGSHFNGINRLVGKGSFEATFSAENIEYYPHGKTITEGLTMGFRDPMSADSSTMFVFFKKNQITPRFGGPVELSSPPKSVKLKMTYDDPTRRWRMFYGLNGDQPTTEFEKSKEGIIWKEPTSESCTAYILMSNGRVEIDSFEIKPL